MEQAVCFGNAGPRKAAKGETRPAENAGPLAELVLIGVIAMRVPDKKLLWDARRWRSPPLLPAPARGDAYHRKNR